MTVDDLIVELSACPRDAVVLIGHPDMDAFVRPDEVRRVVPTSELFRPPEGDVFVEITTTY